MRKFSAIILFGCLLSQGCATNETGAISKSNPAAGAVKKTIIAGITTQKEIFEVLGPPNIITTSERSNEVWTYAGVSAVKYRGNGYWNVVVGGMSGERSSTSTFTLMIEFHKNGIVMGCGYKPSDFQDIRR